MLISKTYISALIHKISKHHSNYVSCNTRIMLASNSTYVPQLLLSISSRNIEDTAAKELLYAQYIDKDTCVYQSMSRIPEIKSLGNGPLYSGIPIDNSPLKSMSVNI